MASADAAAYVAGVAAVATAAPVFVADDGRNTYIYIYTYAYTYTYTHTHHVHIYIYIYIYMGPEEIEGW